MADITPDPLIIETTIRLGNTLFTFYHESQVIGSLLLNPETDQVIIDAIPGFLEATNKSIREQRRKEERIRRDVRKSGRDV